MRVQWESALPYQVTPLCAKKAQPAFGFFHPYPNGLLPDFYGPGLEMVSFPAYIPAIAHAEPVTVERTNDISHSVYKTTGQDTPRMGAFIGKSKDLVFPAGDTDLFALDFRHGYLVISEIQFIDMVGDFVPGYCHMRM